MVADAVAAFHRQYAGLFGRLEAQRHSERYLRGLLTSGDGRRSAATIAGSHDGAGVRALQRFLSDSHWSVGTVVAALQRDLGPLLSAPDGVFVLSEIGFRKQGTRSVGVSRQACAPLGDVAHCQVGIFLAYASARGRALIDTRLYLPRDWSDDSVRRRAAGVPDDISYRTREELGIDMLRLARRRRGLAGEWLASDGRYAQSLSLRQALDAEGMHYLLEVPRTTQIFSGTSSGAARATSTASAGGTSSPETRELGSLATSGWEELALPDGDAPPRLYRYAARPVLDSKDAEPGVDRWLIVRREAGGGDPRYYLSNASAQTPLAAVARIAMLRQATDSLFRDGQDDTGLGEYEVRSWPGWHHHMGLALLAGAFLVQTTPR